MAAWLRPTSWLVAIWLISSSADALSVSVAFTAANFESIPTSGVPPIEDPVSGVIVYDAASLDAPIEAVRSISLVIASHVYTLSEIGFHNEFGTLFIGGLIDGVTGSGSFEDDFMLVWNVGPPAPQFFMYAVPEAFDFWLTTEFVDFIVATAAEPTTTALLLVGLVGLARRRSAANSRRRARIHRRPSSCGAM